MPQPKSAAAGYASELFDTAYEIREQYSTLLKARQANRESLRNMAAQGHLDAEQLQELEELYPERKRAAEEAEEAASDTEAA